MPRCFDGCLRRKNRSYDKILKPPRVVTLTLHPAIDRVIQISKMTPGATFDGRELLRVPAGKGVNTARALSELLAPAKNIVAAAWLGTNEARWFSSELKKRNGIQAAICPRACATRFALTFLEDDGRETHIKECMAPPSEAEQAELLRFWRKTVRRGDIVALCGSTPAGVRTATLSSLFEIARENGAAYILVDSNGPLLLEAAKAGVDFLKGNASEIGAWLNLARPLDYSIDAHRIKLFKALNRAGAPKTVLITLGAKGAVVTDGAKIVHAPPPELDRNFKPVSTTGCGDAATAGVLWSLLLGESNIEMELARALVCGTAKLSSADPGGLSLKQVNALLEVADESGRNDSK